MFYEAKCVCGCIYINNFDIKKLKDLECCICGEKLFKEE
jgi:hypothetical protein